MVFVVHFMSDQGAVRPVGDPTAVSTAIASQAASDASGIEVAAITGASLIADSSTLPAEVNRSCSGEGDRRDDSTEEVVINIPLITAIASGGPLASLSGDVLADIPSASPLECSPPLVMTIAGDLTLAGSPDADVVVGSSYDVIEGMGAPSSSINTSLGVPFAEKVMIDLAQATSCMTTAIRVADESPDPSDLVQSVAQTIIQVELKRLEDAGASLDMAGVMSQ